MTTIYSNIYTNEVIIKTDNKKGLKKALNKVFGDNGACYMEAVINTGNGYEISLASNYAIDVYNNM